MPKSVWFISDYGIQDEFTGVVKAVIHSISPDSKVIDITHNIPPYQLQSGALTLARAVRFVRPQVVLAVVDPGVGTERRRIAIEIQGEPCFLVGPDNGLLIPAAETLGGIKQAVILNNERYHFSKAGGTFDGRDIFASVTGYICQGVSLAELGEQVDPKLLCGIDLPVVRYVKGSVVAEVIWIDNFGNAQLSVGLLELKQLDQKFASTEAASALEIVLGLDEGSSFKTRIVKAYADLKPQEVGLVVDSYEKLSIAMYLDSAKDRLGISQGDTVSLKTLQSR